VFVSPGDSMEEIQKTLDIATEGIAGLVSKFEKLNTHTKDDFIMVINIPAEFKTERNQIESSLKTLEKNGIRYLLIESDDLGKPTSLPYPYHNPHHNLSYNLLHNLKPLTPSHSISIHGHQRLRNLQQRRSTIRMLSHERPSPHC
jgi:hypothetical protein